MRPSVQADFDWQRAYIPEMKRIVGEHLIAEAPMEEDAQHNTDLIVLRLAAIRIACRVRRAKYAARYVGEFTIRSGRPNGAATELAKVISGWGDYMLYGFAGTGDRLACWTLGDLSTFRLWIAREQYRSGGRIPGEVRHNPDGSSSFRAYRISDLPPEFVVARKSYQEGVDAA